MRTCGLAKTNLDRSKSLFERQLIAKQALDDTESRYQSAQAQLDLARAQAQQSKARLDELQINLGNTIITSPVNGFISRRLVDPGASVGQNAPVVEVVDISRVRLIANVVEKDLKQLQARRHHPRAGGRLPRRNVHGPHRARLAGARSRRHARRRSRSRFPTPPSA